MNKKYFTYWQGIIVTVICSLACLVCCLSVVLVEKVNTCYIAFAVLPAAVIFIVLMLVHGSFPEITDIELRQRNILFVFIKRGFHLYDIEKVDIRPLGRHWPAMRIYLKNSKHPKNIGLNGMGSRFIKPFVEELRSKGVTVECEPYELDGRMVYL